jgi:hypothetical protein
VKPANQKEYRRDRRLGRNQNGKRKVVVVIRERGGIQSRLSLEPKAKLRLLSGLASRRFVRYGPFWRLTAQKQSGCRSPVRFTE